MTEKDLFNAIGGIDEKWIEEAEYSIPQKKSGLFGKMILPVVGLALILTVVSFVVKRSSAEPVNRNTTAYFQSTTSVATTGENPTTGADSTTVSPTEDEYAQSYGGDYFFIPVLPSDRTIMTTGEKLTDEEAAEYFESCHDSIVSALSASGVPTENIVISKKGYSHVSYTGVEGESLTLTENFRDYLFYSNGRVVAIITLVKENGVITDSPAFGGTWFDDYSDYLNAHKGQELVYVYANTTELIIAPDNSVYSALYSLNGGDAASLLCGLENPYEVFYHSSAVYIPE